jgi:hypothetical protein
MIKRIILLAFISLLFFSCKKNGDTIVTSDEEFIHYTVNGVPYAYDAPADRIFVLDFFETPSFVLTGRVQASRIPSSPGTNIKITYEMAGSAVGSSQLLQVFFAPNTGAGYALNSPTFATSSTPVMLNITEYGIVGEYIAGNFSCVLTDPPPISTVNTITCNFRIKRTY